MLEYLLIAVALLALWHFIVDGIVAPDHQILTRVEVAQTGRALDKMRDRRAREIDAKAYYAVRAGLEALNNHPGLYTMWSFNQAKKRIEKDGELQRQIAERSEVLNSITDPELKEFRDKVPHFAAGMLTCNSAGWMIFLVPIGLALGMYRSTERTIKAIVSMPEPQLSKMDRWPQTTLDKYFR